MENAKSVTTPMAKAFWTGTSSEDDNSNVNIKCYEQMIGSLLYLAIRSRSHILAPMLILRRIQESPTSYCHKAAKRILRYLKGSISLCMMYEASDMNLNSFVGSDHESDNQDRISVSGYIIKLGKATCTWSSKKQSTIMLSTCEADCHAMTMAAKKTLCLRTVLTKEGLNVDEATPIRSDNQSAKYWV